MIGLYRGVLIDAQDAPIDPEEWRRAQRKLATSLTLRAETPLGRLVSLGASYQALGRYRSVQDVVEAVMGSSPEDGRALLAARPFDRMFSYTLGPGAPTV